MHAIPSHHSQFILTDTISPLWTSSSRQVVATLLELAYLPPAKSLHAGRIHINIAVECDHDKIAALLGTTAEYLRSKYQVGVAA